MSGGAKVREGQFIQHYALTGTSGGGGGGGHSALTYHHTLISQIPSPQHRHDTIPSGEALMKG